MKSAVHGNIDALATGSVARQLWQYSLPAVLGMVVNSLYNVIDRIFIGQGVGPDAIAGLAVTFPVMNLATAVGVLVGVGSSARISIMLGAGNRISATEVLGNALTLTLLNGIIYLALFGIFMDDLLLAFGASAATLPYAHDFMTYLLPGMMMANLTFSFNNVMRASGYPVRAMVTLFIGTGVNLVLAPVFIFLLGWGIKGAAIATDIAMTVTAVFVMAHFVSKESTVHFTRGTYRLKWRIVWAIVAIGAAPSIVNFAGSFIQLIVNNTLKSYGGDAAVAANGIFNTVTGLLVMVVIGICQGMQPIVGYNYGAGKYGRSRRAFWLATGVSTLVVSLGTLAGLFLPYYIGRAFTPDHGLIAVTENGLRIGMRAFFLVGFQVCATSFFQSIGRAGKSIFLSLTRQVLFLIPLLLWLPGREGLDGVWMAFPGSDILATVVTLLMIVWQFGKMRRYERSGSLKSA